MPSCRPPWESHHLKETVQWASKQEIANAQREGPKFLNITTSNFISKQPHKHQDAIMVIRHNPG